MSKIRFAINVWAVVLLLAFHALNPAKVLATQRPNKPNIILIFTDDQGNADLGVQGQVKDVKTPHIDKMAREGVRFTAGYVSAPQCVPSRAGLLTGRYQTRFNLETNNDGPLPLSELTIAERLKTAGYVTGMVGKWHLQRIERIPPQKGAKGKKQKPRVRRFDIKDPHLPGGQGFDEYFCGPKTTYVVNRDLKGKPLPKSPVFYKDKRFRIDVQTEAALSFIDRHAKETFFLYLAYFAPHVPLEAPDKYQKRFPNVKDQKRKTALAMISAMDDGVGQIMQKLRQHGIDENTLIIFISDNGAPLRPAAWNGSLNLPFVGEKGMLTDGGIRVPFIMYWKCTLPRGRIYDRPVISLDVCATAVALAGQPHDNKLDGVNLMPYVKGEKKGAPHEVLYWRWRSQCAILTGKWKLVKFGEQHRFLFDMESKQGEKLNLIAKHPGVVQRLERQLRAWSMNQNPVGLPREVVRPDMLFLQDHLLKK